MKIVCVPTGGLCNRLRSIATAIAVAKSLHCPIIIRWNNSKGLKADFIDLFKSIDDLSVKVIENRNWIYCINGTRDYMLRIVLFKFLFEQAVFNYSIYKQGEIYDILKNKYHRNLLLVSCYPMCNNYNIRNLFRPQDEIEGEINNIIKGYSDNTIGVHIRRTDNSVSIKSSPLCLFIDKMRLEIKNNETTKFYLASDDDTIKEDLIRRFPNRIISIKGDISRDSLAGMKFAVIDLFCLSKTKKILGSVGSSYSQIASEIGNINIEYVK